jgi:hypothetical protein
MARRCTVCDHPCRAAIDLELKGSESNAVIALRYGLNAEAVRRHKEVHLMPPVRAGIKKRLEKAGWTYAQKNIEALEEVQAILDEASDPDQKLRALDRKLTAVKQGGTFSGELANAGPSLTINLIELGVKDEQEGRRLIDLGRAMEEINPAEELKAASEVLRGYIEAHPDERERVRKECGL